MRRDTPAAEAREADGAWFAAYVLQTGGESSSRPSNCIGIDQVRRLPHLDPGQEVRHGHHRHSAPCNEDAFHVPPALHATSVSFHLEKHPGDTVLHGQELEAPASDDQGGAGAESLNLRSRREPALLPAEYGIIPIARVVVAHGDHPRTGRRQVAALFASNR